MKYSDDDLEVDVDEEIKQQANREATKSVCVRFVSKNCTQQQRQPLLPFMRKKERNQSLETTAGEGALAVVVDEVCQKKERKEVTRNKISHTSSEAACFFEKSSLVVIEI